MTLLTPQDIAAMLKLAPNYVRDKIVKRHDFPRPAVSFSQKSRRWNASEVNDWLCQQNRAINR